MENNSRTVISTEDVSINEKLLESADILNDDGELYGSVRRIDEMGRLVLPIEYRKELGIEEKDAMAMVVNRETGVILIQKYTPSDVFTGETEDLLEYKGKYISRSTLAELNKLAVS